MFTKIKSALHHFRYIIFHPQWFVFRDEKKLQNYIANNAKGLVLDIGCADMKMKKYLHKDAHYIGLDYYTTSSQWYMTKPNVFGDAQYLPLKDNSVDTILLLDVLEHLPDTEMALSEIYRTLKPGGVLVIQTPFLYPIHDKPLDFYRWTRYGLEHRLARHSFIIDEHQAHGGLFMTAAVITNIAITKSVLTLTKAFPPFILLAIPAALITGLINILSYVLNILTPTDEMMPISYRFTCRKNK